MKSSHKLVVVSLILAVFAVSCSGDRVKNEAKEAAARYWQEKAYPGKSYDVQVVEAEKVDGGNYRVKGIVDGETRVGVFSPESETFSEGYYSLAHEREKRIAELEQESKYWKEKADALEKDNYKLKIRLNMTKGKAPSVDTGDDTESVDEDAQPKAKTVAPSPAPTP